MINIGNIKMIQEINAKVCGYFRKDSVGSITKSMGTLIICEDKRKRLVREALCEMKLENVMMRGYKKEELVNGLLGYSFCRTIIMVDCSTFDEYELVCLPNCIVISDDKDKVKAILRSILN